MKRLLQSILPLLLLIAAGSALFHSCTARRHQPGVLVAGEPVQTAVEPGAASVTVGRYSLTRLADFDIRARVLRTKRYYDRDAKLSPYDFAVGWGPMSDQRVLDQLRITQGNRFFFYRWQQAPPIPQDQIVSHATNMHLIPASRAIRWKMAWTRAGDVVRLQGWLVEAQIPGRPPWRSSMRRTDSGRGACEIMLVTSLESLPPTLNHSATVPASARAPAAMTSAAGLKPPAGGS